MNTIFKYLLGIGNKEINKLNIGNINIKISIITYLLKIFVNKFKNKYEPKTAKIFYIIILCIQRNKVKQK
jgi:hypothetical protein